MTRLANTGLYLHQIHKKKREGDIHDKGSIGNRNYIKQRGNTWREDIHKKRHTERDYIWRKDIYGEGIYMEQRQTKRENIWGKDIRGVGKYTRSGNTYRKWEHMEKRYTQNRDTHGDGIYMGKGYIWKRDI